MAITYLEISYPNFVLGAIIDPEEANQNNHDFQTKINDIVTNHNLIEIEATRLESVKANIIYVDGKFNTNAQKILTHKTSTDHDTRYYTKTEAATKTEVNTKANKSDTYTREELAPWLRGGDTNIKEDVFTIINPNNGDGTFSYSYKGEAAIGSLGENGEQIFNLVTGYYEPGLNRIEAMINDTLRRSSTSGGLEEINGNQISLTSPEGAGAEITFKYYERVGMTAEYNIKMSATKPPFNYGKNMWFEVIQ